MDAEYKLIYDELIKFRNDNPLPEDTYTEAHHIKPASMCRFSKRFGERNDYKWDVDADDKDNIVRLLPNEHFKAHYYLWKIYRTPKTAAALRMMLGMKVEDITDNDLVMAASDYEQLRIDVRPLLVLGAKMNLDKMLEGGIANNAERISNGTHNFIGVMPWDNIRVKRNAESMKAWSCMHEIYDIWVGNNKCTYRRLGTIVKRTLSIDCKLEGMVNIFKNQQKYDIVVQSWPKEYNQ